MLAVLPKLDQSPRDVKHGRQSRYGPDPLHEIEPVHYVRLLAGLTPDQEGKVACPFHEDDRPSLHVYGTPEEGWSC
jgi:hypothetical protein